MASTVAEVAPRQRVHLTVRVREVHEAGHEPGGPVLFDAVVDDGTGAIVLRWLGRVALPGIVPGSHLVAEGTAGLDRGRLVVLNPLYELC